MVFKLFYSPLSPPSRAVCLVLKALNLQANMKEVDLLSKNYLAEIPKNNPQHTVPTLVDDKFVLWDSHAISIYLVEKYGKGNNVLYPENLEVRAIINQRLHFNSGILYPWVYTCIYPILFHGKKSITINQAAGIKQAYDFLNEFLKKDNWLGGKDLTIADLCCLPAISTLDYILGIKENRSPHLFNYLSRCQSLPFYEECNQEGLNRLGLLVQEKLIRENK